MDGTPYYTNSSHLPVGYTDDIFSALDIQDELQTLYTSGTVFHAFLGEKLPDWKAAATLVKKIAENYKLPYYTMSPTYSVCKEHGYLTGEQPVCPHCGQKTEVYSRITGYYRPVANWNDGKTQEYKDRKVYDLSHSHLTHTGPKQAVVAEAVESSNGYVVDENIDNKMMAGLVGDAVRDGSIEFVNGGIRKEFIENAVAADFTQAAVKKSNSDVSNNASNIGDDVVMLFKTATCPNCKIAGVMLDQAGISYKIMDAEENPDLVEKFGIMQAPTLVVARGSNYEKYNGVSDIKGWIGERVV